MTKKKMLKILRALAEVTKDYDSCLDGEYNTYLYIQGYDSDDLIEGIEAIKKFILNSKENKP